MRVNNPTVQILRTRTSKRGSTPVPTCVLTESQVNLQVLPHIGNVTVLVSAVGALVPLILARKSTRTLSQVTVHPVLVTMVDRVLHALVTVRTYDVFRPLLTYARGVDPTNLELKVHVGQRLACVGERNLFVAMLAVNDPHPATVSTQSFFHVTLLVGRTALGALSHLLQRALLARNDIKRFLALALHAKFDELGGHFDLPLERVTHKPVLHVVNHHRIQTSESLLKGNHLVLHVQFERHIAVDLHCRRDHMSAALGFTTRTLLNHGHVVNPVLWCTTWVVCIEAFS